MKDGIIMTNQDLDSYMHIQFEQEEYLIYFEVVPFQTNKPCFKCGTTKNTIEYRLIQIGSIYHPTEYYLVTKNNINFNKIIETAVKQIKKEHCFVSCEKHISLFYKEKNSKKNS